MKGWPSEWATQSEGFWLNDKLAVPGLSNVCPLNKLKGVKLKPPKPFKRTPSATFKAPAIRLNSNGQPTKG